MSEVLATASHVPGLELELRTDTQFATAFLDGRPFATIRRRHACDPRTDPAWRIWYVGDESGAAHPAHFPRGVIRRVSVAALASRGAA